MFLRYSLLGIQFTFKFAYRKIRLLSMGFINKKNLVRESCRVFKEVW